MKIMLTKLVPAAIILLVLPILSASAGEKPFPNPVPALYGSLPEGFAIGRGAMAYNGSVDGSIYKVDLRSGQGETLVEPEEDFNIEEDCFKLGMRVDRRTNYLFVAGCINGNAYVFDADTGEEIMRYQLAPMFEALINDLTITRDAVYFTDSARPFIYRLPLSKNGQLPAAEDAATAIPLTGDFVNGDEPFCCAANGIVSSPNGKTLIIGHSNYAQIFRVDPNTGHADEIMLDTPLSGFLDGLVMRGDTLYILTPSFDSTPEMAQVVALDEDMLTGELLGFITDPLLDGVASGALFGKSLYVNNARYFAPLVSEKWITKLNIHDVQ
jgi:sugar lactone lactonase YvrE